MSEEIVGIRVFAELESGKIREVAMTKEEIDLWSGLVARFYQNKFSLSPFEAVIPLLKPKPETNGQESPPTNVY